MPEATFSDVRMAEDWGVANGDGYHIHIDTRVAMNALGQGGEHFVLCHIAGERIAVFLYTDKQHRAEVSKNKPGSIDAAVFADVTDAKTSTIAAEIGAPPDKSPAICAFAAAIGAYSSGELEAGTQRCVVRIGDQSHEVTMELDPDPNVDVWKGTVKSP